VRINYTFMAAPEKTAAAMGANRKPGRPNQPLALRNVPP